jgi:hypothetical protein
LESKGGQYFKCLADDKVITREFIRRKFSNYLLYLESFESDDRRFELERVSTSDVWVASGVELGSEGSVGILRQGGWRRLALFQHCFVPMFLVASELV